MANRSEIRRQLDEIAALDTLIWTKRRCAGRELARLRSIHPTRWREYAGVDDVTADHLLNIAGYNEGQLDRHSCRRAARSLRAPVTTLNHRRNL